MAATGGTPATASGPAIYQIPDPQIPVLDLTSPPPPSDASLLPQPPPPPAAAGGTALATLAEILANEHFNIVYLFAIIIPLFACIAGKLTLGCAASLSLMLT